MRLQVTVCNTDAMLICLQGGRVASSLAHAQPELVIGAIFFSYPLHPPGKQVC